MKVIQQIAISTTVIVLATVTLDYMRKTKWYRKHIS